MAGEDFRIALCESCGQKNRLTGETTKANCSICSTPLDLAGADDEDHADFDFPTWGSPENACDMCGWGPAQPVKYNSVAGNILWWRWFTFEAVLCRSCSRAMFHENQASTMAKGWWGLIAPLATLAALIGNLYSYQGTRSLHDPEGKSRKKYVPLLYPIDLVKPFWRRPAALLGTAIAIGILLFIGVAVWNSQPPDRDDSGSLTEPGTENVFDLKVGDCLPGLLSEEMFDAQVVPCTEPHRYEVYSNQELAYDGSFIETKVDDDVYSRCEAAFESYVGLSFEESRLYVSVIRPTMESWATGDRAFSCLVTNEDENLMRTGSVKGSRL